MLEGSKQILDQTIRKSKLMSVYWVSSSISFDFRFEFSFSLIISPTVRRALYQDAHELAHRRHRRLSSNRAEPAKKQASFPSKLLQLGGWARAD